MPEYYEGTSDRDSIGDEDVNLLEAALNDAAQKYFAKHKDKQGELAMLTVVELEVIAAHNPIHGYRVVLRGES